MDSVIARPRIATVLGTRPEIIKLSPLLPRFDELVDHVAIHTGQHYDDEMDAAFFRELALRLPDHNLRVGSGSQGSQLGHMLIGIEEILEGFRPDLVFVQGDTNSTLAGALAAARLAVPVVHLEAGCRSFNRAMPEERNRVVVDHLAALCLAPDEIAAANLAAEGIGNERVEVVGSTGIDACLRSASLPVEHDLLRELGVERGAYLLVTIHRAENTAPQRLTQLLAALADLSTSWPIVFPVHPRTRQGLGGWAPANVRLIEPVGYATMMQLVRGCHALLTDSGGLQEEAAVLGTPTFILREETEWRAFVDAGRHLLVGTDAAEVPRAVRAALGDSRRLRRMRQPIGRERAGASERTIAALARFLNVDLKGLPAWTPPASNPSDHSHHQEPLRA